MELYDRSIEDFKEKYTVDSGCTLLPILNSAYGEFAYQHGIPDPVIRPKVCAYVLKMFDLSMEHVELRNQSYIRLQGVGLTEAGVELALKQLLRHVAAKEDGLRSGKRRELNRRSAPLVRDVRTTWDVPEYVPKSAIDDALLNPDTSYILNENQVESITYR
jgi:hypothetical protein